MKMLSVLFSVFLSGCLAVKPLSPISSIPTPAIHHEIRLSNELQYLSCNYRDWCVKGGGKTYGANPDYKKNWASSMHALPATHFQAAQKALPYALMSSNVYRDPRTATFALPGWVVFERQESNSGLALEEWHQVENGTVIQIVVVYKGTDGITDWPDMITNLSLRKEPRQYAQAQEHFKRLLERTAAASTPVAVSGHSLGGGIALNVSFRQSTIQRPVPAYVFNTSPRGFYDVVTSDDGVERLLLDENAEFLRGARVLWRSKIGKYSAHTFNFLDFRMSPTKFFLEHSMYRLSRGLLLVSVGQGDPFARQVFKENFDVETIEQALMSSSNPSEQQITDVNYCKALLLDGVTDHSVIVAPMLSSTDKCR